MAGPLALPKYTGSVPEGLDAFLNESGAPQASTDQSPELFQPDQSSAPLPEGLEDFLKQHEKEEKYGTAVQQGKEALEGAAQGILGPVGPAIETKILGVNPEDIRGRAEVNPGIHYASEIAGFIVPALLTGGASPAAEGAAETAAKAIPWYTQAGAIDAISKKLAPVAGETLSSKIGAGAANAALDNFMLSGSDEVSKMILQDPNQSAETAIANLGLSTAIGGLVGGGASAAMSLWTDKAGDKASKFIQDFQGRMKEHVETPDPVGTMTGELGKYYGDVTGVADEVYGPEGLKAKDIAASMPEYSPKMSEQAIDIASKLKDQVGKMVQNTNKYPARLTVKLQDDLQNLTKSLSGDNIGPQEIFSGLQDLKTQLQGYSKFGKFVKPFDEAYDFVKDAKGLGSEVRQALEDPGVWGNAAKRQQQINKAFSEYLPALNDFQKKFTSVVGEEKVIDPGKVASYLKQLGNPNAELKQEMLKNFLNASEKYKKVINDTHANLGLESPIKDSPMNVTLSTLDKKTLGAKVADAVAEKIENPGDWAAGGVGGAIGSVVGHPVLGAIIGKQALAPFFNSVLRPVMKSLLEKEGSAQGLKAAVDFGSNLVRGNNAAGRAAKGLFQSGSTQLVGAPTEREISRLGNMVEKLNVNQTPLFNAATNDNDNLGHYMPEHSVATTQVLANSLNYLNSLRPKSDKQSPLDSTVKPSAAQKGAYNSALALAQNPLTIMNKIKDGTITPQDIGNLNALYPSLANGLKQKIIHEMTNHVSKNGTVPYKTRLGISMFLGQPMDSTMLPESIQLAQPKGQPSTPQQPPQGKSRGRPSAPALQKLSNNYQTFDQAKESRRNK